MRNLFSDFVVEVGISRTKGWLAWRELIDNFKEFIGF